MPGDGSMKRLTNWRTRTQIPTSPNKVEILRRDDSLDRIIERVVLKNVTKTFGATAVRSVSLVIDKAFVLIERQRFWKSTLLRIRGRS